MKLSNHKAREILRLKGDTELSSEEIEQAFLKMVRRYPIEQFPERFTKIREAYEVLSDPMAEVRAILYGNKVDLSSMLSFPELKNPPAGNVDQEFLVRALKGVMHQVIDGGPSGHGVVDLDDDFYDDDDEEYLGGLSEAEIHELIKRIGKIL